MKKFIKHGFKFFCCILLAVVLALSGLHIPAFETVKEAKAASTVVENAISWAISIANNNSHGYSQSSRWGPDYDCSSFVISAFKAAGVNVGTATTTRNMRSQFTQHGFQWIPWSQIGGVSNLRRGDILLNEIEHTELYLGNNQNVGAHSNRGYPQTGDQTGTEVSVSGYYYHPWNGVLRYVGSDVCSCSTNYAGDYYVSTNSLPLTMRSGHGTGYSAITSIPKGSKVYVSRADGKWAHVEWNGYKGYCSMDYLTRYTSKSYNLHVWVSDTGMGNVPSKCVKGNRYYICYELIDESTGKKANETSNINYKATETVRNSKGKVFEHTYDRSDYNWISIVCDEEDTYTGTVTISGDVGISCSVSFDVYANTAPQIKVWAWESDDSKEISTIGVGETTYCSYLVRDKYTKKNLNDVTTLWTRGTGYTVNMKVYDPSGKLIKNQSYKNNDCTWISFIPDKIGDYKIKLSVTGNLSGDYEKVIKAEEKEHKYGSWTITKKPTCTQTGTKTRTCSICKKTQTETIPATGHDVVKDNAVSPTYTHEGLTEGSHCCVCGKVLIEQKPIPKLEHAIATSTPTPTQTPKPTSTVEPIQTPVPTTTPIPTAEPSYDDDEVDDDIYDDMYDDMEDEEDDDEDIPPVGTILEDDEGQCVYKVTKPGKCVAFRKVINKKITQIEIPDTVTIDGIKYKVTEISSNAFRGCKKLKKVVIGKNVSRIGKKAFFGCRNLKKIVVKTKKLSIRNIGSKAFKGIHKKVIVQIPKGQQKKYKKLLIKLIKKITI